MHRRSSKSSMSASSGCTFMTSIMTSGFGQPTLNKMQTTSKTMGTTMNNNWLFHLDCLLLFFVKELPFLLLLLLLLLLLFAVVVVTELQTTILNNNTVMAYCIGWTLDLEQREGDAERPDLAIATITNIKYKSI
ncbi:unnamed protein product [Polarella glacialis]|uniref:Uncharacterized protein n=1 Tax=Polarella glacialis TaxID=89957 RepID=A0A813KQJ8_POLGL|nr:unnamed protein product [Polarella glacialis]